MCIIKHLRGNKRVESALKALPIGILLGVFFLGYPSSSDEPILVPNTNSYPFIGGPGASPFQLSPPMSLGPNIPNSTPLLASGRLSLLNSELFKSNHCPSTLAQQMNLEGVTSERSTVNHPLPQDCNVGTSMMIKPNSLPGKSGHHLSKLGQVSQSKQQHVKSGS